MQKGGSQGRDFLLYKIYTGCMPEQISVLQSPSTLRSIQHADPCHMQLLIHLDTTENNGPGEEEQRSLAKTMNADASNVQASLASLLPGTTDRP